MCASLERQQYENLDITPNLLMQHCFVCYSVSRKSFMGTKGEITVDQAHRGACVSTDGDGYASMNPLFMKYTPTNGMFSGQGCYGVKSFENFIELPFKTNWKSRS